jgi:formiminoglutamate deiminase
VSTFWCELAWLGGAEPGAGVLIDCDGERIASVAAGVAAPDGARVLEGLTLPGLANAHSHSFQRAMRGRTQRATGGSFWSWRERMYEQALACELDDFHALARATFAEMALAGITLVGEFHYLHHDRDGRPYGDPNALGEAIMSAAQAAGIRVTLIDACYLHGGLPRFHDAGADAWTARVAGLRPEPHARLGAAIHSVRAVDPGAAREVVRFARERDWPLHAHVSEQPAENQSTIERYGKTPTALLSELGALSANFTAIHTTHMTETDVGLIGESGACCCLCPTTERDLADGIGPARELIEAGARLSLGSDSQAVIDMFEEARAVELDERLATLVRGCHAPVRLAEAMTSDGYACLGWPEGGRIRAGALADLVSVSLRSVRLAGTRASDALDAVLFAGSAADVHTVIVGGREVVRDGAHRSLDVAAELSSAIAAVSR